MLFLFTLPGVVPEVPAQSAGDPCIGGTLYYVAFPDTVTNLRDVRFPDISPEGLSLMIYSPVDQQVTISTGNWNVRRALSAGEVAQVDLEELEQNTPLITWWNRPTGPVARVEAQSSIVLYAIMSTRFGTAGFTPLPVDSWGTEYFAATWPGMQVWDVYPASEVDMEYDPERAAPAEIMVIAAYDNTQISISPTGGLHDCQGCTQVTLDAGEAYLVESYVDLREEAEDQEDIAGTLIQSTRPIGVVTGNTRTNIRPFDFPLLAGNSPKDMIAEWLRPTNLHGREFTFTPTWDQFRPGGNADSIRDAEHLRLFPTDEDETTFKGTNPNGRYETLNGLVDPTEFVEWRVADLRIGRSIRSSAPAQVFHATPSMAKFNGTTGSGNFIGASYLSWGSSIVELLPREAWVSFAPFRAPDYVGFRHFVNILTDSSGVMDVFMQIGDTPPVPVHFSEAIPGTDLVWTSVPVNPGTVYRLFGRDETRFTGTLYGGEVGYELYRPGGIWEDGKENRSSSAHPAEYEEVIARSYALPLAGSTCSPAGTQRYIVDTLSIDCDEVVLRIRRSEGSPLDLQYLTLSSTESRNVRLELIEPEDFSTIDEATTVVISLALIYPAREGAAVVRFRDNTRGGEEHTIEHRFGSEAYFTTDPLTLQFNDVTSTTVKRIVLSNGTNSIIDLQTLSLASGSKGFRITRVVPTIDWADPNSLESFGPGDSVRVWISFNPEGRTSSVDTLVVDLRCGRMALPIVATAGAPCLFMSDLDFGSLNMGQTKTLPLEICNTGAGKITFQSTPLSWLLREFFSISQSDIETLKNATLDAGDCVTINVTFTSQELVGHFRSVARLWASTRNCRDTSIWSANVGISTVSGEEGPEGYRFGSLTPNPTNGELRLTYDIARGGLTKITLIDATGREVGSLFEGVEETGPQLHALALDRFPSGLYFLRVRSGAWERIEVIHVVR